jgi:hypothetical protein
MIRTGNPLHVKSRNNVSHFKLRTSSLSSGDSVHDMMPSAPNKQQRSFAALTNMTQCLVKNVASYPSDQLRDMIARDIDYLWAQHGDASPEMTLKVIDAFRATLAKIGASNPMLDQAIETSVRILRFLFPKYAKKLSGHFCGAFIVGSMSYGRFYSVSNKPGSSSDLDLFLISPSPNIPLEAITLDDIAIDSVDCPTRLLDFSKLNDETHAHVINYKLENRQECFLISLTICSLRSFQSLLQPQTKIPSVLHWTGWLGGASNIQFDLTRNETPIPYIEDRTEIENWLTMPVFVPDPRFPLMNVGLFNGIATMLAPRFEAIFATEKVTTYMNQFVDFHVAMARRYSAVGLTPELCNIHFRRDRFSPYFVKTINEQLWMRQKAPP